MSAGEFEVTATYDSLTASAGVKVIVPEDDREILGVSYDRALGRRLEGRDQLADRKAALGVGGGRDRR